MLTFNRARKSAHFIPWPMRIRINQTDLPVTTCRELANENTTGWITNKLIGKDLICQPITSKKLLQKFESVGWNCSIYHLAREHRRISGLRFSPAENMAIYHPLNWGFTGNFNISPRNHAVEIVPGRPYNASNSGYRMRTHSARRKRLVEPISFVIVRSDNPWVQS